MDRAILLAAKDQNGSEEPVKGTRMGNFSPLAGSVVVFGYDLLGDVAGIALEAREILDDKGGKAKGALVTVTQDEYHIHNSFIDAEEIPELVKGIDALLGVRHDPTSFKFFEVKYKTKGDFELLAFNNANGYIVYGAKAGTGAVAQVFNLQSQHLERLKTLLQKAEEKLNSLDH